MKRRRPSDLSLYKQPICSIQKSFTIPLSCTYLLSSKSNIPPVFAFRKYIPLLSREKIEISTLAVCHFLASSKLKPQNRHYMGFADSSTIRIYTVNGATTSSSSSLPDWLTRKRQAKGKGKRAIKEHVEGTIELIQGFEFPEASNRVKTTRDGHHVIATGTYKPQMRVWDLDHLSLKFERHSDAENVDFVVRKSWPSMHKYIDSFFHYRSFPMTGLKPFTYKTIVPSNCTLKEASIIAPEYHDLVAL